LGSRNPNRPRPDSGLYYLANTAAYLVQKKDDKASVDLSQCNNDSLVSLVRIEDLVKERIQVAKGAHKDHDANDSPPCIGSLK
jgi:hypothetical protein